MERYQLYYLRGRRLTGADAIDAADDRDAIRIARERGDVQSVEIWNARGRVRVVAPATNIASPRQAGR